MNDRLENFLQLHNSLLVMYNFLGTAAKLGNNQSFKNFKGVYSELFFK